MKRFFLPTLFFIILLSSNLVFSASDPALRPLATKVTTQKTVPTTQRTIAVQSIKMSQSSPAKPPVIRQQANQREQTVIQQRLPKSRVIMVPRPKIDLQNDVRDFPLNLGSRGSPVAQSEKSYTPYNTQLELQTISNDLNSIAISQDLKKTYINLLTNQSVYKSLAGLFMDLSTDIDGMAMGEAIGNETLGKVLIDTIESLELEQTPDLVKQFDLANTIVEGKPIEEIKKYWILKLAYIFYSEAHKFYPWSLLELKQDDLDGFLSFCINTEKNKNCSNNFSLTSVEQPLYFHERIYFNDYAKVLAYAKKFFLKYKPQTRAQAIRRLPLFLTEEGWTHHGEVSDKYLPYLDPLPSIYNQFDKVKKYPEGPLIDKYSKTELQGSRTIMIKPNYGQEAPPLVYPILYVDDFLDAKAAGCQGSSGIIQGIFAMMGVPSSITYYGHMGLYFPSENLSVWHADAFQTGDPIGNTYPVADMIFLNADEIEGKAAVLENASCSSDNKYLPIWLKAEDLLARSIMAAWKAPESLLDWDSPIEERKLMVQKLFCTNSLKPMINIYQEFDTEQQIQSCPFLKDGQLLSKEEIQKFIDEVAIATDCSNPIYLQNQNTFKKKWVEDNSSCKDINTDPYKPGVAANVIYVNKSPLVLHDRSCENIYGKSKLFYSKCSGNYSSTDWNSWSTDLVVICPKGCDSTGTACQQ